MPGASVLKGAGGGTPRWVRLGATAVAAVVVAEAAAWALRPREVIEPVDVDENAYFEPAEVERAEDYRSGQRLLYVGGVAAQGALLVLLITGRPAVARRALERAGERPVLGGAAAAAGLVGALSVVSLPFDVAAHERAVDVGLSTQDLGAWLGDWAKANAISAAIAAGVGTGLLALIRRFPDRWWVPGSAALVALAAAFTWLAPVVLAPAFNDFEKLPSGQARSDVLELGERAGVEIGEVYERRRQPAQHRPERVRRGTRADQTRGPLRQPARRGRSGGAALGGRPRARPRGRARHPPRTAVRGDLGAAGAALRLALQPGARAPLGAEPGQPASLPALAVALAVTSFAIGVVGNQLSRAVEARADTFALELTDDPQALIGLQQRLAKANISDPDPPDAVSFLLGTHPTALERIGAAKAWQQGQRTSSGDSSASRPGPP